MDASQPFIVQFLAQKKQKQSEPEALFPLDGASTPSAQPSPVESPTKIKIKIASIKSLLFDIEADPALLRRFSELGKQLRQRLSCHRDNVVDTLFLARNIDRRLPCL